jgi:hypothetical protein
MKRLILSSILLLAVMVDGSGSVSAENFGRSERITYLWGLIESLWALIVVYEEPIVTVVGIMIAYAVASDQEHPLSRPTAIVIVIAIVIIAPIWRRFVEIDFPWYLNLIITCVCIYLYYRACVWSLAQKNIFLEYMIKRPDFLEAQKAIKQKNYSEAYSLYKEYADRGNAAAQANLGMMHEIGVGGDRNDQEAEKWYRKAAEQGLAEAQFLLTQVLVGDIMMEDNDKSSELFTEGYVWVSLAAFQGHSEAKRAIERLAKRMTPEQLGKARKLIEDSVIPNMSKREFKVLEGFRRLSIVLGIGFGLVGGFFGIIIAGGTNGLLASSWIVVVSITVPFVLGWGIVRTLGWIIGGFVVGGQYDGEKL